MARLTPPGRQSGFTYIAVLIGVAIVGAALAAVGTVWHTLVQRENEKDLLFVGRQFRSALSQYFLVNQRYPMRLEDLVADDSKQVTRRYLRKIFFDPMTGRAEWGSVKLASGQIVGVYSLSEREPLKKRGFAVRDEGLQDKQKYSEWLFLAEGQAVVVQAEQNRPGAPASSSPFMLQPLKPSSAPR